MPSIPTARASLASKSSVRQRRRADHRVSPAPYAAAAAGGWYLVFIPLADLGAVDTTITRVQLQEATAAAQPVFYLDEIRFTDLATSAPAQPTLSAVAVSPPSAVIAPGESIQFSATGTYSDGSASDVPCNTGWEFRLGINRAVGYTIREYLGPVLPMDPAEKDKLYRWRLEYYPHRIEVYADLEEDGVMSLLDTFPVDIPWGDVYVQLLGVAYQASKHPQDGDCGAH